MNYLQNIIVNNLLVQALGEFNISDIIKYITPRNI